MTHLTTRTKATMISITLLGALLASAPRAEASETWDCAGRRVTDAVQCGTEYVVDGAKCGWDYVTSGAQCGWDYVTSGTQCGYQYVTSAAQCGWNFLKFLFGFGKKPASCFAEVTCAVPQSCDMPRGCDMPKSCDIEECLQPEAFGECIPGLVPCDLQGFSCDPLKMRCLPDYREETDVVSEAICEGLYNDQLSEAASDAGVAMTYSSGFSLAIGVAGSIEVGTVYGPDGEYGCFRAVCEGGTTDLSIGVYAAFGMYSSWSAVAGTSYVTTEGASVPFVEIGFTTAQVFDTDWGLIGSTNALSIGVGLSPVQVGLMTCDTVVYQVGE